jgi:hypothetical protein
MTYPGRDDAPPFGCASQANGCNLDLGQLGHPREGSVPDAKLKRYEHLRIIAKLLALREATQQQRYEPRTLTAHRTDLEDSSLRVRRSLDTRL